MLHANKKALQTPECTQLGRWADTRVFTIDADMCSSGMIGVNPSNAPQNSSAKTLFLKAWTLTFQCIVHAFSGIPLLQ